MKGRVGFYTKILIAAEIKVIMRKKRKKAFQTKDLLSKS